MTESAKQPPRLKRRTLSLTQHQLHNFALGEQGEVAAQHFLKKKSYIILETNFCFGPHEVDIIALDQALNELFFFEVKTRSQDFSGNPNCCE